MSDKNQALANFCFSLSLPGDKIGVALGDTFHDSVKGIRFLVSDSDKLDSRWLPNLLWLRDGGALPPLYCIHHSGGDVGIYRKLVRHLEPNRPVIGIQSRMLVGATTEFADVDAMAIDYAEQIMHHRPRGEILLLGFSFGGFVASAIAQQLRRNHRDVAFLGLVDSDLLWANDDAMRHELALRLTQVSLKFQSVGMLTCVPREKLERDVEEIADVFLGDFDASPEKIVRDLNSRGYTTRNDSDAAKFADFVIRFTTHLNMVRRFRPNPVEVDLHLWWPDLSESESEARSSKWQVVAQAGLREVTLDGSHFSILRMPTVRTLANQIDEVLNESPADHADQNLIFNGTSN